MNEVVFALGASSSVVVVLFLALWFFEGLRTALLLVLSFLGLPVAVVSLIVFWMWVAGAFS